MQFHLADAKPSEATLRASYLDGPSAIEGEGVVIVRIDDRTERRLGGGGNLPDLRLPADQPPELLHRLRRPRLERPLQGPHRLALIHAIDEVPDLRPADRLVQAAEALVHRLDEGLGLLRREDGDPIGAAQDVGPGELHEDE